MLFLYKPDFQFRQAKVEKKVCLPAGEFEEFLKNPLGDMPYIVENIDLMQEEQEGIYHCLLVTGEGRRDGVLVESEGYRYARYASYVPDAAALEYDSLSEFGAGLSRLADQMIQTGTDGTRDGNWIFYLDQVQEGCDFSLSENPALAELLADMLVERPEVSMAYVRSDCLELRFYPELCPNCQKETENRQDLAGAAPQARDPGEMMQQKDEGQTMEAWADVLDAKVARVFQGYSGLQMELSGVKASRLEAFSAMLAGYCSVEDYENWVNEPEEGQAVPVMQEG